MVGRALFTGKFSRDDIVCTKTLYNYVNKGLIVPILAIELPLLIRRKRIKKRVVYERKRIYGRSIVYYARPYCSGDKGTNENQNGLFRRFIKKHTSIRSYTDSKLAEVENWANQLPRRILSYRTAQESFDDELSNILNS